MEALVALGFANANLSKAMLQLQLEEIGAVKALQRALPSPEEPFRAEIEAYDLPMTTEQTLSLSLDGRLRKVEVFVQSDAPCSGVLEGTVDDERWFVLDTWPDCPRVHAIVPTSVRRVRVTIPAVTVDEGEGEPLMAHVLLVAT